MFLISMISPTIRITFALLDYQTELHDFANSRISPYEFHVANIDLDIIRNSDSKLRCTGVFSTVPKLIARCGGAAEGFVVETIFP